MMIRRGYALLFAFVFLFYLGMAALPAYLIPGGHETAGVLIYKGFFFFCHQYPWRSWFIGGPQSYYPLTQDEGSSVKTFEEAAGSPVSDIKPKDFYGSPEMGYKMAVCQRDVGIYAAMAVFCLFFFTSGNRLPEISWKLWLCLGVIPMGIDGGWQLLSRLIPGAVMRESSPVMRTITGALFGFFTCWYLLPILERSLQKGTENDCQ